VITSIYPGPVSEVGDLVDHMLSSHRPGGRRLMLNMIATLDGATAWGGTSSGLGDDDDRRLFHALRAACDVVLVGAETVRSEGYHPIHFEPEVVAKRQRMGLDDVPRLAMVSRSLELDPLAPVFAEPDSPPYVLTGRDAPSSRHLASRAEVVEAGDVGVDPARMLDALFDRGHEVILCEGGPTLNGQLVEGGLVDELNLTLSPMMVTGDAARLTRGRAATPLEFRLDRLMMGDRMLFARYVRGLP
jgi:riboflavin biosynthesis pyrimidine reductase